MDGGNAGPWVIVADGTWDAVGASVLEVVGVNVGDNVGVPAEAEAMGDEIAPDTRRDERTSPIVDTAVELIDGPVTFVVFLCAAWLVIDPIMLSVFSVTLS